MILRTSLIDCACDSYCVWWFKQQNKRWIPLKGTFIPISDFLSTPACTRHRIPMRRFWILFKIPQEPSCSEANNAISTSCFALPNHVWNTSIKAAGCPQGRWQGIILSTCCYSQWATSQVLRNTSTGAWTKCSFFLALFKGKWTTTLQNKDELCSTHYFSYWWTWVKTSILRLQLFLN